VKRFEGISIVAALAFVLILTAIVYVSGETAVYYWDYSNYYRQLFGLAQLLRSSGVLAVVDSVAASIHSSDYNPTPILPLLPPAVFIAENRAFYVCGLLIVGLLPVLFLVSRLTQLCWLPSRRPRWLSWYLLVPFLSPLLWISPLRGYPDLIGLVPLACLSLIGIQTHSFSVVSYRRAFTSGFLMWLTFLLRRYFAYALLAFFLLHLVNAVRTNLSWRLGFNYLFVICGFLIPSLLFQNRLLSRIISTNYSDLYAAYDLGFWGNISSSYAIIGPIPLFFVLVGIFIAFIQGRRWVLFHGLLALVTYLFFQFTQKPGPHHLLPIFLWLLPALSWPVWLQQHSLASSRRSFTAVLMTPLLALSWLATFVPALCNSRLTAKPTLDNLICPQRRFVPLRLQYWPNINQLVQWLLPRLQPGSRIAVIASSSELNADILTTMMSGVSGLQVRSLGDIDQRDGFDLGFLKHSDVLIISDPPLLHRPSEYQRVVSIPASLFIKASPGLGARWTLWRSFQLSSHPTSIRLMVFRRKQDAPLKEWMLERRALIAAFRRFYPQLRVVGHRILF